MQHTSYDVAELLTTEQAAELLGVHPDTLRIWVRRGLIENVGSGRTRVYLRSEIQARRSETPGRLRKRTWPC